ncbi:hypothetical protein DFH27DRAFT_241002 [Peziza echinospora]|nr:hypothetical protein DFH27DRAFT_241002 [Peziza echinospora]
MFWDKWPLWQKLALILVVISFFVCMLGVSKMWWLRIQRHRIAAKANKTGADKAELGEIEQTAVIQEPKEEDEGEIPFGIRALEAGVEVEGVVISRPASPRPTSPRISHYNNSNVTLPHHERGSYASLVAGVHSDSPRSSIGPPSPGLNSTFRDNYPMMHPIRGVHQPNPYSNAPFNHGASSSTVHHMQSHQSSPATTRNPSVENVSDHSLPRYPAPRGTSPAAYAPAPVRVSMLSMQQRRSGSYTDPGRSVTPSGRSPSPPDQLLPVMEYEAGPSRHSDTSDSAQGDDSQSSPAETPPDGGRTGDLMLLRTHRLSHAAEVGQLSRRTPGSRPQSLQPVYQSPPPHPVVFPTAASPLYAVDTQMPTQVSPTDRSPSTDQNASRMSISTFQFNQNVELARELFQPHLAESASEGTVSPIDENLRSDGERSKETSPSRPNSIGSKKAQQKKLAKKPRPGSGEQRA